MKISYNYLVKCFDIKLPSPEELVELFTFRVFEVEGIEKVGDDTIFDLKVLPDRAHYALSWDGIAYELAAALGVPRKKAEVPNVTAKVDQDLKLNLKVVDTELCRRYMGRRVRGVTVTTSPEWLKSGLEAVGQRSINSIVDATNYVMLYSGQPLHAFDADKVVGTLTVRRAQEGEKITTLDGKEVSLNDSMLVIADDNGPLAIAGVKGGKRAEVTLETKNLILESANFDPTSVRRTSTKVQIKNDSSKRFENDLSPETAAQGMDLLSSLIAETSPQAEFGEIVDVYPKPAQERTVSFSPAVVSSTLGHEVEQTEMEKILNLLEIVVVEKKADSWIIKIPHFRLDLVIPEDITEEIGRLVGYDKIVPKLPGKTNFIPQVQKQFYISELIKNILVDEGYSETILYTLGKKGYYETAYPVATDKAFLRTSHLPNLEASITMNTRNADLLEQEIVRQFEVGKVFDKDGEHLHLGLAVGFAKKIKGTTPVDVLKAAVAKLSEKFGIGFEFTIESSGLLAWGECSLDTIIASYKVPASYTDLSFSVSSMVKYVPISHYPFAVRDVAVFVPEGITAEVVKGVVGPLKGSYCVRFRLFDVFTKEGKTSYAFRLVFQAPDKTLTEEEITTPMNAIYEALKAKGWEIR